MSTLRFNALKGNYSSTPPAGFAAFANSHWGDPSPNTCAVRLAYAIFKTDSAFFKDIKANAEWYGLPVRASELAHILAKKLGQATRVKSAGDIGSKTGIIFFDTIRSYGGSGHISLWNQGEVVDGGDYFDRSPRAYLWPVS